MSEDIKDLEKVVNKLKFIAGQKGGELHDLVEDRLLSDFEELLPLVQQVYDACKVWSNKNKELIAAK